MLAEVVAAKIGLRAQGHMPTIERMLIDGASWEDIGAAIHWNAYSARDWWCYALLAENRAMRSAKPTWISVDDEDHKPPIRESYRDPAPYVLACDAKGRMSVAYADKHSVGYVWVMAKPIGAVTHWMPLPDPPEEA